jgi:hypothetical protein
MTNRIVLSSQGLLVSKPGLDVLTSLNPNQLSLDSNRVWGVYSSGVVICDFNQSVTVNFGVTFSNYPLVQIQSIVSSSQSRLGYSGSAAAGSDMPTTLTWDKSSFTISQAITPGYNTSEFRYVIFYTEI